MIETLDETRIDRECVSEKDMGKTMTNVHEIDNKDIETMSRSTTEKSNEKTIHVSVLSFDGRMSFEDEIEDLLKKRSNDVERGEDKSRPIQKIGSNNGGLLSKKEEAT